MDSNYLIIYHREDNDGIFSAALVRSYLMTEPNLKVSEDDIELRGMDYNMGRELEADGGSYVDQLCQDYTNIIMVDFSLSRPLMKRIHKKLGTAFVWIDHHLPVIKDSFANGYDDIEGIRDHHRSAILNAYKFCYDQLDIKYRERSIPELLVILSAYDSFTYEQEGYTLEYVRDVNTGINVMCRLDINAAISMCYDLEAGKSDEIVKKAHEIGVAANEYEDFKNGMILQQYGDYSWKVDGRDAVMLMVQGPSNSFMFDSAKPGTKNGIVLKRNPNGTWTLSLYNINKDDEFHCGNYLKDNYKGGGHLGAAGAQITEQKVFNLLKTKTL